MKPTVHEAAGAAHARRAKPMLGTIVDIQVQARTPQAAQRALTLAFQEVAAVHRLMSFHDPDSDLARLNRAAPGAAVRVDARTAEVLHFARQLTRASGGAFDVEVADALVAAGHLPDILPDLLPDPVRSQGDVDAQAGAGAGDEPARPAVRVVRGRHRVDLGGVAKGYAVDRAIERLQRCGVDSACVNAGGDLRVWGARVMEIELRDPLDPARPRSTLRLHEAALASSATGGLCTAPDLEAGWTSALIDVRRRRSLPPGGGVSVLAGRCMAADALTKVVLVSGGLAPALARCHRAEVVLHRAPRPWQ